MGMIKNDIDDVVQALLYGEGRSSAKIGQRLIEAGLKVLLADDLISTDNMIEPMDSDGHYDIISSWARSPYPKMKDQNDFSNQVQALVDRGYKCGIAHDEMMSKLGLGFVTIGRDHGWVTGDRFRVSLEENAFKFEMMPRNTPEILTETPQEADSGLPTPPRVRDIVSWLQRKAVFARQADMTEHANALDELVRSIDIGLVDEPEIDFERALRGFYADTHERNVKAGWWSDLATGQPKKRSVGELFILIVTELWEAYDAYVTNQMDDKLPHLPGLGVELGDVQIRVADFCGALLAGRIVEDTGTRNPGDEMFLEIGSIASRYEKIRKSPEAKGDPEQGEPIEPQDVAAMITEKLAFNATREDHKPENRMKEGGKQT